MLIYLDGEVQTHHWYENSDENRRLNRDGHQNGNGLEECAVQHSV